MYSDKMAAAIKVNGRTLRESGDTAYLPFGAEYSIYIKNLNTVRALVSIEIDGQSATDGTQLIVPANGSIDIERFIKNGNFNAGNRFKFIERTAGVEQHRGVGAEDGLIRIEFEFERVYQPVRPYFSSPFRGVRSYDSSTGDYSKGLLGSTISDASFSSGEAMSFNASASLSSTTLSAKATKSAKSAEFMNVSAQAAVNQAGITAPGSISEQKFVEGDWFPTDGVKHVLVMRLLGEVGGQPIAAPVLARAKQKCTSCGHLNKAGAKFCTECGTSLIVL